MTLLLTSSGAELDVRYPSADAVDIDDIAHSLAQINRFTGHARRPYSVAEHSLLVMSIVAKMGGSPAAQLAGLMHDAHEAYCGDLASPSKAEIGADWHEYEGRWQTAVRRAFGLFGAFADHGRLVHTADMIALATEKRDLMPRTATLWPCLQGVLPIFQDLSHPARANVPWHAWRDEFLMRFHALRRVTRLEAAQVQT